jgi:hypothetical protein
MSLLMSDTLLIDPLLDDALRLRDGLHEWAFALDATHEQHPHEAADLSEWPGLTSWSAAVATDAEQ